MCFCFTHLRVPGNILDIRNIGEDINCICVEKICRHHIFNLLSVVTGELE